jgi:hypothetical protein
MTNPVNPKTLTMTLPTTYTNGTPMPLSEIADILILYGNKAGGPYTFSYKDAQLSPKSDGTIDLAMSALPNLTATGNYFLVAQTEATNGKQSNTSTEVGFSIQALQPSPPTALVVKS